MDMRKILGFGSKLETWKKISSFSYVTRIFVPDRTMEGDTQGDAVHSGLLPGGVGVRSPHAGDPCLPIRSRR